MNLSKDSDELNNHREKLEDVLVVRHQKKKKF
jgi:hypothetical protein